jgi:beta-lactamase regulating signal transducer with metallopeptidase domain
MSTTWDLGGTLLEWILLTLLHGTVLALLTWLLASTLLRRVRPAVHAVLWAVVLLKFLIPPAVPVPSGMSAWLGPFSLAVVESWRSPRAEAVPETPLSVAAETARTARPEGAWGLGLLAAASLYVLGLALLSGAFLRRSAAVRRWVSSLEPAPPALAEEVARLAEGLKLRRVPEVRVTQNRVSPFVMGILQPKLVIPKFLLSGFEPPMRAALFVHELAHLRRGDVLLRWVQSLAGVLLFFWPPVRWACRNLERAAELACDQWAVAVSRVDPEVYARSLLDIARCLRGAPTPCQHPALARSTTILEERFVMLLHQRKRFTPGLSRSAVFLLGLWAWFSLAGAAGYPEAAPGEPEGAQKKVMVYLRGEAQLLRIQARVLPEADLDADGFLNLEELRAFQETHPEVLTLKVEAAAEGPQDITVEFRDASPETHELSAGEQGQADILYLHSGEAVGGLQWDSPDFQSVRKAVRIADPTELLRRHPEADLDGNSELDGEELRQLFQQLAPEDVLPSAGTAPMETVEVKVLTQSAPAGEVIRWEAESAGPQGEKQVMIIRRLTEKRAPQGGPTSPEQRRQDFLKSHPEADLDGDGVISEKEAEALAAKAKAPRENKPDPRGRIQ